MFKIKRKGKKTLKMNLKVCILYMKKKIQDEAVALSKMKRYPKVFFSLAKKKEKIYLEG